MISTKFLIVSVVALVIFGWHVFVIMQLWPPESYLFHEKGSQSSDVHREQRSSDSLKQTDTQRSNEIVETIKDAESTTQPLKDNHQRIREIDEELESSFKLDYEAEKQHIEDQWDRINGAKDRIGLN